MSKKEKKFRKNCLDFANYYNKDVTAIQLYDDIIDFVILRARGNAVPSYSKHARECLCSLGGMSSQLFILHLGYCSPSDFLLRAARGHFQS